MEIVEFIFGKLEILLFMGILAIEVWYYFVVPGLKEIKRKEEKDQKGRRE